MRTFFFYSLSFFFLFYSSSSLAQGGYMSYSVTQPSTSLAHDGTLQISLTGFTRSAHINLYRVDSGGTCTYIDSGLSYTTLPDGNYAILGALGSHNIITTNLFVDDIHQYLLNDLVGYFTLGQPWQTYSGFDYSIHPDSIAYPSTPNSCDGNVFYHDPDSAFGIVYANVITQADVILYNSDTISPNRYSFGPLCPGRYVTQIGDHDGNNTYTFFMGSEAVAFPDIDGVATQQPASAPGGCDGSVTITKIGGRAPFTYVLDSVPQSSGVFMNVCEGLHHYYVTDSIGDTSTVRIIVVGSIPHYVVDSNPWNQLALDTIIVNHQNCNFDYSTPVDSGSIDSIVQLGSSNAYIVTFVAWQQGVRTDVTDTVYIDTLGVNMIELAMYCDTTHRAVQGTYHIIDYADPASRSILGIADIHKDGTAISIHPNPVIDKTTVTIDMQGTDHYDMTITDVTGRIAQRQLNIHATNTELDVSTLNAGIYTVTMRSDVGLATKQLVKY